MQDVVPSAPLFVQGQVVYSLVAVFQVEILGNGVQSFIPIDALWAMDLAAPMSSSLHAMKLIRDEESSKSLTIIINHNNNIDNTKRRYWRRGQVIIDLKAETILVSKRESPTSRTEACLIFVRSLSVGCAASSLFSISLFSIYPLPPFTLYGHLLSPLGFMLPSYLISP